MYSQQSKRLYKHLINTWKISFILSANELNALTRTNTPLESNMFILNILQKLCVTIGYFLLRVNFSTKEQCLQHT